MGHGDIRVEYGGVLVNKTNSKCKKPELETFLACLKNVKESDVAGREGEKRRG